ADQWSKHLRDLIREAAKVQFAIDTPYSPLTAAQRCWLWHGAASYEGIRGFFRFLEEKGYKMHYRIFAARLRCYTTCSHCAGYRLRPEALYVKVGGEGTGVPAYHIGEVCELTTADAKALFDALELTAYQEAVGGRVMEEIRKRLRYLVEVGLDYLTLDRLSQTLSGGESQRINLATSL